MKKKLGIIATLAITSVLVFGSISVFATNTTTNTDTDTKAESEMKMPDKNQRMVFGKVTAIDGDKITLVTAEMPNFDGQFKKHEKNSEEDSTESIKEKATDSETEDKDKPKMKEIEFTGDEITIDVSDESLIFVDQPKKIDKTAALEDETAKEDTTIKDGEKRGCGERMKPEEVQGSLSDIKVGSIINLHYTTDDSENETLNKIIVRNQPEATSENNNE